MAPLVAFDARDAFATEIRGWGRYTRCLLSALRSLPDPGFELLELADGGFGPEVLFEQLALPVRLRRARASLVHAPNCFLPLVRPCPGVVTIHDLAFETWPHDFERRTRLKFRTITRAAARSAERVICPSRFTADDVCDRYGVDPAKLVVIAEAPALAVERSDPPVAPYLLAVGDLRAKKNFGELVRAFVEVHREFPDYRLILAGVDAGSGQPLRALANAAPVSFTGYVSDGELDRLMRGADLVVHPSLYEGFGLVVLEAMARGTPVLAARATALPETGGDAAAYFAPGELAPALARLLADRARLVQMSAAGVIRAQQFSWERAARETADVYRELIT
jgi:glycosyltransferase involved in cell wall biosynthesis